MIVQISDWIFDVDIPATMEYSAHIWEDHCLCGYCRNFYEALNGAYPPMAPFLEQFGMNSLTPEEMSPIEPTLCMVSYFNVSDTTRYDNRKYYINYYLLFLQHLLKKMLFSHIINLN